MGNSLAIRGFMNQRPRRFTTFVTLLWLNLAMLPCTMAAGGDDHQMPSDCPSRTGAAQNQHGSAHAHAQMQHHEPVNEHAENTAGGEARPCMSGDDCCALDDLLFSDSTKKLDQDSGSLPPVAYVAFCFDDLIESNLGHAATGPPILFAGAIRLHALNCVYRD